MKLPALLSPLLALALLPVGAAEKPNLIIILANELS